MPICSLPRVARAWLSTPYSGATTAFPFFHLCFAAFSRLFFASLMNFRSKGLISTSMHFILTACSFLPRLSFVLAPDAASGPASSPPIPPVPARPLLHASQDTRRTLLQLQFFHLRQHTCAWHLIKLAFFLECILAISRFVEKSSSFPFFFSFLDVRHPSSIAYHLVSTVHRCMDRLPLSPILAGGPWSLVLASFCLFFLGLVPRISISFVFPLVPEPRPAWPRVVHAMCYMLFSL
jgi:hypothetical protein